MIPSVGRTGTATFVAVAAIDLPDGSPPAPAHAASRGDDRALHDAASTTVLDAAALLVLAAALPAAVLLAWRIGAPPPSGAGAGAAALRGPLAAALGAVACAAAALPRIRARWATGPQADRRLAVLATAGLALLALWPWCLPAPVPAALAQAVCVATLGSAFAGAALLAPVRPLALAAAALPLSPALLAWTRVDAADPVAVGAGAAAGVLALCLALRQHRRWRVAAAAGHLQRERLQALEGARDAAIKADQEKSRFLAIASHDLRQPVHAIGLFAATLEKRLQGSAEEPLVRNMSRAIDGLDRSFNVMLDISRLDAGAIEPRIQQFPLRDLFRRLHMHFAGQAEQKGLGLRFSPGGKSVSSDPQLLERVLGNLVQNAIKYTERGGIVVVARSTATHTHVEVWDTGIGIRAADLARVFEEFYQVGQRERVRTQGLGMGLAIVKRLVRLLGHELVVASRPGSGTMFRVRIPIGGLPGIADITAGADTLPMPLLQPRMVLVLEDEEAIRESLCLLLREWGYDAVAAASIDEAEAAVAALDAPPDLILSDLHLGDGPDGIKGIEAIRRRCGRDIAAMLITGDTSHSEIRRATESGHRVLFKPVQPRKLYDALRGLGT